MHLQPTKPEAAVRVLLDHLADDELPEHVGRAVTFLRKWADKRQQQREQAKASLREHIESCGENDHNESVEG